MRNNTFHRKAPRRTLAVTAVLALVASLTALGASPAAAMGIGTGRFGSRIHYDYPGPLDPPASTSWTSEIVGIVGPGTIVVGGHTWVGPNINSGNSGGAYNASSDENESYLDGHGTVHNFSQIGANSLGEWISFVLSGNYQRTGESMTLSLTGDATVYHNDPYEVIAQGSISIEVTLFFIPDSWNLVTGCASSCLWHGPYTQTDGLVNEPPGFPSDGCDTGQQISDNTTQGVHSKLYVRQPTSDSVDVCVRVELVPSGEGYGGKLAITPTGLDPDVSDPLLPSQDANATACTNTTPNLVPGAHPITSGGLGGVDYMIDVYASDSEAWLCLQVDVNSTNLRVKVPLGNSVPQVTYGSAATWYPDPGTP